LIFVTDGGRKLLLYYFFLFATARQNPPAFLLIAICHLTSYGFLPCVWTAEVSEPGFLPFRVFFASHTSHPLVSLGNKDLLLENTQFP
jgi:hypothetical protein